MSEIAARGYVGRPVLRREDARLLTGSGRYVADLQLPRMLHVAFVRSQVAHARIRSVNLERAASAPGVVLALSGADLAKVLPPVADHQVVLPNKWKAAVKHQILNPNQPLLATDKARHVGEALALIVADSRYAAEDAADLAEVDLEPLASVVDVEAAIGGGGALIHEQFGTNVIADFTTGKGDVDGAFARAPRRLARRFWHHRYSGIPMETRGVVAEFDTRNQSLTVWSSTQVVAWVRREVAGRLNLPEAQVRAVALDVGGGFGVKGHVYPEDLLIPFLAKRLGRPVKWIEDRREHLLSSIHSRDQVHYAEVAFDDDGRILALRDRLLMDCGAWNPVGLGPVYNTVCHLPGPYRIENYTINAKVIATNKVPNAPYRGAGRPEGALVMERLVDLIARELKIEPAEVRRRNMIPASAMPYSTGLVYRDGEPIVYDSGDYPALLEKALDALGGLEAFRKRQAEARRSGRYLGLGLGSYTEGTGVGPFEGAMVRLDPTGKIHVAAGAVPFGQGMETVFAQIAADAWQVTPEDVVVTLGDTAAIPMGFGTIASRSTVTVSAAMHEASKRVRDKVFAIAGNKMEVAPQDLELRHGTVGVKGVPGRSMTLADVARAGRPGWDHSRPPDVEAGMEATVYYEPPTVTWAYATHAAVVEIDTGTGHIRLDQYVIAHDCGVIVNPLLAEGQIMGGAVQGIGGGLFEEFTYDADGQLLNGTLADYLCPTASDIPEMKLVHSQIPSPLNPLGVKGLGEGGAISPPVAIANAVADALVPFGEFEFNTTPIKPEQIVAAVRSARGGRP